MTTITTIEELEAFIEAHESDIESGELCLRWSNGPEADAANGWVSKNYSDPDNVTEEDGLSAARIWEPTVNDVLTVARTWNEQTFGEVCYLLTGNISETRVCPDGEPLVWAPEPLAVLDYAAITRK